MSANLMNKKETKLLVENWRKVLNGELLIDDNNIEELIEEGKLGNFVAALPLFASIFLNPSVGNALTPEEVEAGFTNAANQIEKFAGSEFEVDGKELHVYKPNGKEETLDLIDTSGYAGSCFDQFLKDNIKTVPDWLYYARGATKIGVGENSKYRPLFQSLKNFKWDGAVFLNKSDKNYDLFHGLTKHYDISHLELWKDGNGREYVLAYGTKNRLAWIYKYNDKQLGEALFVAELIRAKDQEEKREVNSMRDLERILRRLDSGWDVGSLRDYVTKGEEDSWKRDEYRNKPKRSLSF